MNVYSILPITILLSSLIVVLSVYVDNHLEAMSKPHKWKNRINEADIEPRVNGKYL